MTRLGLNFVCMNFLLCRTQHDMSCPFSNGSKHVVIYKVFVWKCGAKAFLGLQKNSTKKQTSITVQYDRHTPISRILRCLTRMQTGPVKAASLSEIFVHTGTVCIWNKIWTVTSKNYMKVFTHKDGLQTGSRACRSKIWPPSEAGPKYHK